MERGKSKGQGLHPHPTRFCLAPSPAQPRMTRKISCPIPAPQGPVKPHPTPPRKTLFFVNFPYNQYNFFNETYFITKNILEIKTKFIPSNQINIYKKKFFNNISKCLTIQSLKKKKKKTHNITYDKIKAKNHIEQNKIS